MQSPWPNHFIPSACPNPLPERCSDLCVLLSHTPQRIKLLGFMMGAYDTESPPVLAIRDTNFLWKILDSFRRANEFTEALLQDKDMQIDITKAKALQCVKATYEPILPDSAVNLLHRISLMPPPRWVGGPPKLVDT